jgi:hypothetical protein
MIYSRKSLQSGEEIVVPPPEEPPGGEEAKVRICHKPNGKNSHTITVLQVHLDHGDTLGPCPGGR